MNASSHLLTMHDGVRLAWAASGHGLPLVRAANWLTHLDYDADSPVWRHWLRFLGGQYRYVRYDERGCGLSDWEVGELSLESWIGDLESVVDAAGLRQPFVLLGISQGAGAAVAYAARHPERVSHLVLYGGYVLGAKRRGDADVTRLYRIMEELARMGWDNTNPAFRQLFTSRFIPEGSAEQLDWFNEMCRKSTTPETAVKLLAARAEMDACAFLPRVKTPTLVLHASGDQVVPVSEGQRLASGIAGAEFCLLPSCNHILLEHEPAWTQFCDAVRSFTGQPMDAASAPKLSQREREVLALLCEGASNAQIASELGISEKTVRNHLSHAYEKLGVHSRTAAIVCAQRLGLVS